MTDETQVLDANGTLLAVGSRVRCGDDAGTVTQITDPDGDVVDYGRTVGINPEVKVDFDDGTEDSFTTGYKMNWALYPDGPDHWDCDDLVLVRPS